MPEPQAGQSPLETLRPVAPRLVPGATLERAWPLAGGVSAAVHAIELRHPDGSASRAVVRRHGAAQWKPLHGDVTATEFALLRALHTAGLPVPAPYLLDDSLSSLPSPYLVMEWIEGASEVASAELPGALDQMARFLARLHALDATDAALPVLPAREDPVAAALEYLPATAEHAPLRALLAERGPLVPRNPPALLHGDYWPGNVIWRDGTLAAVIDWEDAAIGDPLCDLAGCRVELTWRHGEDAAEAFSDHYRTWASPDETDLPIWELFVASAGAAFMHEWGLAPEVEADMRAKTRRVLERASGALLGGAGPPR